MPLYEREEDGRRMFYRLDLDGTRLLLEWGAVGAEGESRVIHFETSREARLEYERHLGQTTEANGYRVVAEVERIAPSTRLADASELERLIAANPDDEGRWTVLEDWLLQQDDIRREVIERTRALQISRAAETRQKLLGSHSGAVSNALLTSAIWRSGYVLACEFRGMSLVKTFEQFLSSPAARLLQRLSVELGRARLATSISAALIKAPCRDALRHLRYRACYARNPRWFDCAALAGLPLRSLDVADAVLQLQNVRALAQLEEVHVKIGTATELARFAREEAPVLRRIHLDLRIGDDRYGGDTWARIPRAALEPITESPRLEQLRLRFERQITARAVHEMLFDLAAARGWSLVVTSDGD